MVGGVTLVSPVPVSEDAVHASVHVQWRLVHLKYLIRVERPQGWLLVEGVRVRGELVVASHVVIGSVVLGWGDLSHCVVVDISELAHLFDGQHLICHWKVVALQHLNDFCHLSKTGLVVDQILKYLEIYLILVQQEYYLDVYKLVMYSINITNFTNFTNITLVAAVAYGTNITNFTNFTSITHCLQHQNYLFTNFTNFTKITLVAAIAYGTNITNFTNFTNITRCLQHQNYLFTNFTKITLIAAVAYGTNITNFTNITRCLQHQNYLFTNFTNITIVATIAYGTNITNFTNFTNITHCKK